MVTDLETSRELRGWVKIFQNAQDVKKMQDFTAALYNLHQAFSAINPEMKLFNENINKSNEFLGRIAKLQESMEEQIKSTNRFTSKSNEFLSRIAKLQESMEAQTRSANRFTYVVFGLAVLQVVIALLPYVIKK